MENQCICGNISPLKMECSSMKIRQPLTTIQNDKVFQDGQYLGDIIYKGMGIIRVVSRGLVYKFGEIIEFKI
jgi:hypothetical protein